MEDDQSVVAEAPIESEQPSTNPESVLGSGDPVPSESPMDSTPVSESKPEEMTGNLVGHEIAADPPSFDSVHVNGAAVGMPSYQPTSVVQNGSLPKEADEIAVEQQFEEVYTLEEERLWNLVRANSLDFNAWTALIEETEKVAESNIRKIRKVYDAFLAEFPLCFGYWKKYADHEGRLDSVDKVVEVFERAVLAVTYSVDIWLHYCVFTISTFEDPDSIRSEKLWRKGLLGTY